MRFLDAVTLGDVNLRQEDGFLVADAFAARTGIQLYSGREVGSPTDSVVAVYRPQDEVFAHAALRSFSHAPITVDHPRVPVTAENWKDLAVGEASAEVLRDGERLRIPLIVKAQGAIDAIRSGKRQLSVGYSCDLEFVPGTAPNGQPYHAIQRNIRANHIAIVDVARAGPEFSIIDAWGAEPITEDDMPGPTLRPLQIDGITIEFTDQGAEAVQKLMTRIAQLTADNLALSTTVATRDTEIGTLKVELDTAKKAAPDSAALDRLAADRATLVDQARAIFKDLKPEGLTATQIRRAAVVAAFGDDMVKDASDAQIEGMFQAATVTRSKTSQRDPVGEAMRSRSRSTQDDDDNGQKAYEQRLRDGWKTKAA